MSSKFILAILIPLFCGYIIGYNSVLYVTKYFANNNSRQVASSQNQIFKLGSEKVARDYFNIEYKTDFISKRDSKNTLINLKIIAKKDLPSGLKYKWTLGTDVSSKSNLSGEVGPMKTGEAKDIEIELSGFGEDKNSHVVFSTSGTLKGYGLQREVVITSKPESTFEAIVQKKNEEQTKNEASLMNKVGIKSKKKNKFDPQYIVK